MSVSTRDRRGRVYPYAGTNDGGFAAASYGPARGTYFCRFSPEAGEEITIGGQAEHRERGVFEFSDMITIEADDLIVENGQQWKVESVVLRRALRAKVVRVFSTSDTPAAPVS